jgi:hypothetical protein
MVGTGWGELSLGEGGGNLQMDAEQLFLFVPIPAKAKKLGLLSIYKFSLVAFILSIDIQQFSIITILTIIQYLPYDYNIVLGGHLRHYINHLLYSISHLLKRRHS